MTLLNSIDPQIAAAQAKVLETLARIPDEYGAVFVVEDYQAELAAAVRAHVQRRADERMVERLRRRAGSVRGRRMAEDERLAA